MIFDEKIDDIIQNLTTFEKEIDSNSNKNNLLKWIQDIDELNKEIALKVECTKVYSGNLEKESDDIEKDVQTQLMTQQKIKELCKELKKDINEIDSIRVKTEKNHEERMQKIQNNYNEVI
jgi:tRNA C32,U32 (ribose-2'-O)-methylase TrmJ